MTNQDDQNQDKSEMRMMWIGSGAIVLLLLGLMGYSMLFHPNMGNDSTNSTELSSQSRTTPQ
jgi:flagellar basal body-associated protein FliL